jgi:integrase
MFAAKLYAPGPSTVVQSIVDAYLKRAEMEGWYVAQALAERKSTLADFAGFLGDVDLDECGPEQIVDWIVSHPGWETPSTKKSKSQHVQACFNWAANRGKRRNSKPIIQSNPFAGIFFEESEPRRPMTEAEFGSLLRMSEPGFRRFLMFLWLTGCRSGEARQIVWEEIDWATAVIVKQKHKTRKKTKKARVIYLTAPVLRMLSLMRRECPEATGEIFRNSKGRPWLKETLDTKILRLRRKIGLADDVVLHCIRHAFGTRNAAKPGANIKLVSVAMGHSSVATTEKYYVNLDREAEAIRREISGNPGW